MHQEIKQNIEMLKEAASNSGRAKNNKEALELAIFGAKLFKAILNDAIWQNVINELNNELNS